MLFLVNLDMMCIIQDTTRFIFEQYSQYIESCDSYHISVYLSAVVLTIVYLVKYIWFRPNKYCRKEILSIIQEIGIDLCSVILPIGIIFLSNLELGKSCAFYILFSIIMMLLAAYMRQLSIKHYNSTPKGASWKWRLSFFCGLTISFIYILLSLSFIL